jgi:uncharacterized membrane protein YciS (DUF1049 family)
MSGYPFTSTNMSDDDLAKLDQGEQKFGNKGNFLICVILFTLGFMIALSIYMGYFYQLAYVTDKISKTSDLINEGKTSAEATLIRNEQSSKLKKAFTDDLQVAGYALGALGIIIGFLFFGTIWYWKGVALPELTRINVIERDIQQVSRAPDALAYVGNTLAFHVHPENSKKRTELAGSIKQNLVNSLEKQILFGKKSRNLY